MQILRPIGCLCLLTFVGCTSGAKGDVGPQGQTGSPGPQGAQGDLGPQGSQGDPGPQGSQGDSGPQGPQGPQGDQGPKGDALLIGFSDGGTLSFDGGVVIVSQPKRGVVLRQSDGGVLGAMNANQVFVADANCYAYIDLTRNALTGFGLVQFESSDCTGAAYGNFDANLFNCRGLPNPNEAGATNRFFAPVQPLQVVSMARGSLLTNGQVCATSLGAPAPKLLLREMPAPLFSLPLWVAEE